MKLFAAALLAFALLPAPPQYEIETLGGFSVPLEGYVGVRAFEVEKFDPHYDENGKPTRLPRSLLSTNPNVSTGRMTFSNQTPVLGRRLLNYAGNGHEVWTPFEVARWKRENRTAVFDPAAQPFDDEQPEISVFTYSQGPYNGYSGAHGQSLGPNCLKVVPPGALMVDEQKRYGFQTFRITDPFVLRSLMLQPGESPGTTATWYYQRTFTYRTDQLPPFWVPYIPIRFEGGTYDPADGGPGAGILLRVEWESAPGTGSASDTS